MTSRRISETGWVSDISGDSVEIRFRASADCARCGLCDRGQGQDASIVVKAHHALSVGQTVRVTFPYTSVWKQTSLVFAAPLAVMLASGVGGWFLSGRAGCSDAAAGAIGFVLAVVGLAFGIWLVRGSERRFRARLWDETTVEPLEGIDPGSCESRPMP